MKKFLLILSAVFICSLLFAPVRRTLAQTGSVIYYWGVGGNSSLLNGDQGGTIELGATNGTNSINPINGGLPYIDFHYGNGKAQDYNARLINIADGRLDVVVDPNATGGTTIAGFRSDGVILNKGISNDGTAVKHVRSYGCQTGPFYGNSCSVHLVFPGPSWNDDNWTATCSHAHAVWTTTAAATAQSYDFAVEHGTQFNDIWVILTNYSYSSVGTNVGVSDINCIAIHD